MKAEIVLKYAFCTVALGAATFSIWLCALPAASPREGRVPGSRAGAIEWRSAMEQRSVLQGLHRFAMHRVKIEQDSAGAMSPVAGFSADHADSKPPGTEEIAPAVLGKTIVEPASDRPVTGHAVGTPRYSMARRHSLRPVLPLVFQEVEPGTVLLEPAQAAAADALAGEFIADSGSGTDDPSTPAYHNKWQREQSLSDQRLRAMIGQQAFASWQMEAYMRGRHHPTP